MSGDEISAIWQRFQLRLRESGQRLQPRLQALAGIRNGRFDLAARLVDVADAVEAGFGRMLRPARRALHSGMVGVTGGVLWRGLAALTGVGLTAMLVAGLSSGSSDPALASLPGPAAVPAAPEVRDVRLQASPIGAGQDGWVTIARPIALFGLEAPELDKRSAYEARRSRDGQRREDGLTFGEFGDGRPFLSLRLHVNRDAGDGERGGLSQPFVIMLVRESAARGLSVGRSGVTTTVETKFGTVETADASLSDGTASRACIAFRHLDASAHLSFSGWWCGSEARPADRAQLICLIDRIDLLSAGDDPELRASFARTELNRRQGCSVPRLAATGRKGSWLDADAKAPALKTASGKKSQR